MSGYVGNPGVREDFQCQCQKQLRFICIINTFQLWNSIFTNGLRNAVSDNFHENGLESEEKQFIQAFHLPQILSGL